MNGEWLTAATHRINAMELSWEEFQGNILLWYGIIPMNLPTVCDGHKKKFTVDHDMSCFKAGLVLVCHYGSAKEWGSLGDWGLTPLQYPTNLR